jgi:methionyl-tRNA formyltransferase
MQLDDAVDHGPVLAQQSVPIAAGVTGGQLTDQLAQIGADLLVETLPRYLSGELKPQPQDHAAATFTHKLERESGELDWSRTAADLERTVRAYDPWPGTYTLWNGKRLKVLGAAVGTELRGGETVGTVADDQGTPAVAAADGWLRLTRLQLEGSAATDGAAFLRGHPQLVGARLTGGTTS